MKASTSGSRAKRLIRWSVRSWAAPAQIAMVTTATLLAACAARETPPAASAAQPTSAHQAQPGNAGVVAATAPQPAAAVAQVLKDSIQPSAALLSVVAAEDRSPEDRALDAGRMPAKLLSFFDVKPGMRVFEMAAGGGYTAELLARAVTPGGQVYAQNNTFVLKRFAEEPLRTRLQKPVMAGVVRVDSEFDAPIPDNIRDLDLILMVLFYHDTVWQKTDRAAMNRAIFTALRPGGVFGIVDHSAAPGAGASVTESLHRIEESVVLEELASAGFVLTQSTDLLRNPEDTRDWNASPRSAGERRGSSDRFVLKFVKPE